MTRIVVFLVLAIGAANAGASTLLVLPDGSGPYPDIQTAIAAAADGDTVLLGDGVFMGAGNRNLRLEQRSLTLRSANGDAANCIVDCDYLGGREDRRFLIAIGGTDDEIVLEGLTIRRAGAFGPGGAIAITYAYASIAACVFDSNTAVSAFDYGSHGGAIAVYGGGAAIEDCTFIGNQVTASWVGMGTGGAVSVYAADVTLARCTFSGNVADNGAGGAVGLYGQDGLGTLDVESCTFAGNGAADGTVFARDGVPITLTACIITGAYVIIGGPETWPGDAAITWGTATITAADCDVWGNAENWTGPLAGQDGHDGNFSANPCFCDATAGDFHLCADSWCAPEHNVAHPGVLVGTLPVGCEACDCDEGPTAVPEAAPAALRLLGVSPNPFNPATVIRFELPAAGPARLTIHDISGRLVATLLDGACAAGEQSVTWRGRDNTSRAVAGGTYLLRLESSGAVVTDKLTLLK